MPPSTASTAAPPVQRTAFWTVTGTEFMDTGAAGTGAVPTSAGTVWSVKNLFELKNARNVVVEHNVFENHWKESQPGYAIVLTPRNSNGGCAWCVVEHVRFEYNLVRNVAAGINLLGYDNGNPSRQAADIVFRDDLSPACRRRLAATVRHRRGLSRARGPRRAGRHGESTPSVIPPLPPIEPHNHRPSAR